MNEKTPQELAEFRAFCEALDNRCFTIDPTWEKFKGSAMGAKHRAMEILATLTIGDSVRVYDHTGTIWVQTKRERAE